MKMAQRAAIGDTWTPTKTFDELNEGGWGASSCALTADELTIIFHSNRPGSTGTVNLWMATRPSTDDPFGDLIPLDEINSSYSDNCAYIMPDGLTLYFNSDRGGVNHDIYKATRASTGEPFGNVELVPVSTDTYREQQPYVTADEETIYFLSDRGVEGHGIWVSNWQRIIEECLPK